MKTKPSDFTNHPFGSLFRNTETEVIAVNIMKILKRTGDTFRTLTFDEYKKERQKDKNFTEGEKEYFHKVKSYCKSADTAKLLSEAWSDQN